MTVPISVRLTMRVLAILCLVNSMSICAADPDAEPKHAAVAPAPLIGVGVALISPQKPLGFEVSKIVPNSPAALSGEIQAGDTVIGVSSDDPADEIDVRGVEFSTVINRIRGPIDSEVRLRIIPKASPFVKEKIVALKRRPLFGGDLIGTKLDVTFTAVKGRQPVTLERFKGRPVVLMFWSSENAEQLVDLFSMAEALAEREAIFGKVELIAVNCDETVEAAETNSENFPIEGLRHFWLDPKTANSLCGSVMPLIMVAAPTGVLDAVSPPDAINLDKFLLQYMPNRKSMK